MVIFTYLINLQLQIKILPIKIMIEFINVSEICANKN
jgi:hypothetical protein